MPLSLDKPVLEHGLGAIIHSGGRALRSPWKRPIAEAEAIRGKPRDGPRRCMIGRCGRSVPLPFFVSVGPVPAGRQLTGYPPRARPRFRHVLLSHFHPEPHATASRSASATRRCGGKRFARPCAMIGGTAH